MRVAISAAALVVVATATAAVVVASRDSGSSAQPGAPPPAVLRFASPPTVAAPTGYSHIAIVSPGTELMFLAGQVGARPDGTVPDEPEAQYEQALANVVALLAAEGASPADLVKVNTYLVRPLAVERIREIWRRHLGAVAPASTLVYVPRLAQERYLVEIEAVAVRRAR
jgi:2-iminobutanoate/2-iminopropanoate deaminase